MRAVSRRLRALQQRCEAGLLEGRPEGLAAALAEIVAEESTAFVWSDLMGGVAEQPESRLEQLFVEFVTRYDAAAPRNRRDEVEILNHVETVLRRRGLLNQMEYGVEVQSSRYSYRFKTAWMNGQRQVMEPISLDYLNGTEVIEKANTWSGRLFNLQDAGRFQMTAVVAKPARRDLEGAYQQALAILRDAPKVRAIIPEDEIEAFIPEIERDLQHH